MNRFAINNPKRRQIWADLLLLLVTLIWGSTFVMVKDAVAAYPVFPFLTLRFGSATLALLSIGWKRLPSLGWRGIGAGMLIGLFLLAGYGFQTAGLQYTSASKAGFITGLSVAMVPVFSALLLRRLPTVESIIGVCLATIGLALLTLTQSLGVAKGDMLVLFCALSFALHIVSVSAFAPRIDALALTIVQLGTVTVASAVISLSTSCAWPVPAPSTWFAAGFTGVLATAVAFTIQTMMQRFTTPTHTALIFTGEPVFAAMFGVLLAHDMITAQSVAGGILIIAGTIISEIRWSEKTAATVSRFISPHYTAGPLLLILGLTDPVSWRRGLLWATGMSLLALVGPLLIMTRELRKGGISDWHVSSRQERLQPIPVIAAITATGVPLLILWAFDGPRALLVTFVSAFAVAIFNLAVTLWWKISQHVSGIAATTTLVTAVVGVGAAPLLLLIPLVAWARVKVGAHTVMETVVGGTTGAAIAFLTLRVCGLT